MNKIQLPDLNLKDLAYKVIYDQYRGKNVELLLNAIGKVIDANVGIIARTFETDLLSIKNSYGIGLDLWGRLVNFPRSVQFKDPDLNVKLEDENFISLENVNPNGTIKRGVLTDEAYRILLQLRLQTQNTLGTVPVMSTKISHILNNAIAINDHLDMQFITFYVRDEFPSWLDALLVDPDLDLLPRPAGTGTKVVTSIWRYLYFKYEGEPDKRLSNFFTSIFYDPKEDPAAKPIYKSIVYYTDSEEFLKQRKYSWYDLKPYENKLKADEDEIKKISLETAKVGDFNAQMQLEAEQFYNENKEVLDPGVWTKLHDEVFKEYFTKKPDERTDRTEQWEIKNAHLEYLIAKNYNLYLLDIEDNLKEKLEAHIDYESYHSEQMFIRDLYLNSKDGYYYTDSNFNIENITSLCRHNNYLYNHFGLSNYFNDVLEVNFNLDLSAGGLPQLNVSYEGSYEESNTLPYKGLFYASRITPDDFIYTYFSKNPYHDHWVKELNKKIDNLPNLDTMSEYRFLNGQPTHEFTEREILTNLFYIGMLAYRSGNEMFAKHLSDMKRCHLIMEGLRRCHIFGIPKDYRDITKIQFEGQGNQRRPAQFNIPIRHFQHSALVYKQTAEEFGGENHATEIANTYDLIAKNIKLESKIHDKINCFLTLQCRHAIKDSFTTIGQKRVAIMNAMKTKLMDRFKTLGNDELANWAERHFDNYVSKLLDKQRSYISKFNTFEEECKDFIDDERYNRKLREYGRYIRDCYPKHKASVERLGRIKAPYRVLQDKANYAYQTYVRLRDRWDADRWAMPSDWNVYTNRFEYGNDSEFTALGISRPAGARVDVPDDAYADSYLTYQQMVDYTRNYRSNSLDYKDDNKLEQIHQFIQRFFEHQYYAWQAKANPYLREIQEDERTIENCKAGTKTYQEMTRKLTDNREYYLNCISLYLPEQICK